MHQNENSPGTGNTEAVEVAADATHKSTSLDAAAQLSHVDVIQRNLNLALADASDNQAKLAYHFAADHGHRVKYTAGLKWFVFDGTRYKADENEAVVTRLLLDTLRALKAEGVAEAAAALDKSDERKSKQRSTPRRACRGLRREAAASGVRPAHVDGTARAAGAPARGPSGTARTRRR